MKQVNLSANRKKMFLIFPALVLPFLTLGFWALGGGSRQKQMADSKGLNLELPAANLKQAAQDKLSFYEAADQDSVKRAEWMRNDPNLSFDTSSSLPMQLEAMQGFSSQRFSQRLNPSPNDQRAHRPEEQILQKLTLLQNELYQPSPIGSGKPDTDDAFSAQLDRLENMMQVQKGNGEDAELQQLQGTLDKILDIQHPDRVQQRSLKDKGAVYAVRREQRSDSAAPGFYSVALQAKHFTAEQNAIEAIIASDQSVVHGAVVKLRILHDVFVNGQLIPAHTLVSGIASLQGERLQLGIHSIRHAHSLYTVQLEVYDLDGLPGIYIPGSIQRDVAKESLNNSLSLSEVSVMDPSLKAQATVQGMGALKSLLSKKSRLIRVQVKAGYKLLLKNKNPGE